jgi:hypothetical protein
MKKIFAVALVAMMTLTVNAQVYVGGGVGLLTSSYDGNSETYFSILPEIGYNINEDWAVGIAVGYGEAKSKVNVAGVKVTEKVKTFQIAPYARYTFAKFDKVNLFVDGSVGYKHENFAGVKTNTFAVGFKPGVAVNLNDKLSFVAHVGFLGYQNDKVKGDDKSTNTFGLNLDGSNLSFGVYYNF